MNSGRTAVDDRPHPDTFGGRLRRARRAKRWTQGQLAATTGLARTQITQLENGRHEPSYKTLRLLLDHLECSADFLLLTRKSDRARMLVQR